MFSYQCWSQTRDMHCPTFLDTWKALITRRTGYLSGTCTYVESIYARQSQLVWSRRPHACATFHASIISDYGNFMELAF